MFYVYRSAVMFIQGGLQNWHHFWYTLTLPNINRFSKLFHCQKREKFGNTISKDPTTLQMFRYSTLSCILKATIKSKTTSVTTHFKKLTTGNNVFIVSVIV